MKGGVRGRCLVPARGLYKSEAVIQQGRGETLRSLESSAQ